MDQRGRRIVLVLIGAATAVVWWWALRVCHGAVTRPGRFPLLAIAATAVTYLCVPETDHLVGVVLLLSGIYVLELVADEPLPIGWHAGLFGVVLWAGVWGAQWRDSAVVGAVFAGWVIVLPALVGSGPRQVPERTTLALSAVATAGAGVVARTGALGASTSAAVLWAVAISVVSIVIALVLVRVGTRSPRRA